MVHDDDTKKFKLPSLPLLYTDLERQTKQLAWSKELPENFNFYHLQSESIAITIDDQESFDDAILFNISELNSHIMRLYVATSQNEALNIIQGREM